MTIESPAERLAALPVEARDEALAGLTEDQLQALLEDWAFWARPAQLPPEGDWFVNAIVGGRGSGKTRSGAEYVQKRVNDTGVKFVNLVGRTTADVRDVMVQGESGILATQKRRNQCTYISTRRRIEWESGAVALCFAESEPDQLRGPQAEVVWCDEPSTWNLVPDAVGNTAWTNLLLGCRLGADPRVIATMTPKPIPLVKELLDPKRTDVAVTRMRMVDNIANLAPQFVNEILNRYSGTRLGLQELEGLLLEDVEGALWAQAALDRDRKRRDELGPNSHDVRVVGVDPSVTGHAHSAEAGILIVGRSRLAYPDIRGRVVKHLDVLGDYSLRGSPEAWAKEAVRAYRDFQADWIVAESNNGGEMVRSVIANVDPTVPVELVTASRGKRTRAEPVAQLSEQGRFHLVGFYGELESQLLSWVPGETSPDRLDGLVWACAKLLEGIGSGEGNLVTGVGRRVRTGVTSAINSQRLSPDIGARRHRRA